MGDLGSDSHGTEGQHLLEQTFVGLWVDDSCKTLDLGVSHQFSTFISLVQFQL